MVATQGVDERRSARANVLRTGELDCLGVRSQVRVGNLSAHGALIIGQDLPPEGAGVTFRCNGVAIEGCLVWVRLPYAGIDFNEVVEPQELLRDRRVPSPIITKDTRVIDIRRPGFRGNQLTNEERRLVDDWRRHS
jgi:hypothetical protein